MTRDSTAPPPAGVPPEPGAATAEQLPTEPAFERDRTGDERPSPVLADADGSSSAEVTAPGTPHTERFDPYRTTSGDPPEIDPDHLDPDALKVVARLRQFGHQAYLVGGCVRDLLLGRTPKDFDIATSAHPGEVRAIFRNCRLIGRRFRLAHVYFRGGKIIEVSTFRANPIEVEEAQAELEPAENGAVPQPAEVEEDLLITEDNVFGTAEQDARRRDFTINGLFYDPFAGKVIDYVRGQRDLEAKEIRTIGDPEKRMREDPVRILRAVRFACKLSFDIESRTYAAMEGAVEDLPRCAPPRLLEETFRLLRGGIAAPSLKLLSALDALKVLLPPVDEFLKKQGPEGERVFFAFAESLDRMVQERAGSGEPVDDAILLAALLLPISRGQPEPTGEGGRPSVARNIEALLQEMVRTARLPRRIAERCRMILIAQRTLSGERRRKGSLAGFRRHPLFSESLTVFEIATEATGEHRAALEAWKAGSAPEPLPSAEPSRRRRRRRRKRRNDSVPDADEPSGGPSGQPPR